MATRFYFNSALDPPDFAPAFSAWSSTVGMVQRQMHTQRHQTPMVELFCEALIVVTANQLMGIIQLCSRPLARQVISAATIVNGGQIRAKESGVTANFNRIPVSIRLMHKDATLSYDLTALASQVANGEFDTVLENRRFYDSNGAVPLNTVDGVDVEGAEGDRLVMELGVENTTISVTGAQGSISVGDDSTTDLNANDQTQQSAFNGWFEIDQTLLFLNREMLGMMGMG